MTINDDSADRRREVEGTNTPPHTDVLSTRSERKWWEIEGDDEYEGKVVGIQFLGGRGIASAIMACDNNPVAQHSIAVEMGKLGVPQAYLQYVEWAGFAQSFTADCDWCADFTKNTGCIGGVCKSGRNTDYIGIESVSIEDEEMGLRCLYCSDEFEFRLYFQTPKHPAD